MVEKVPTGRDRSIHALEAVTAFWAFWAKLTARKASSSTLACTARLVALLALDAGLSGMQLVRIPLDKSISARVKIRSVIVILVPAMPVCR